MCISLHTRRWLAGLPVCLLLVAPNVMAMGIAEALQRAIEHDPLVPVSNATYDADLELGSQVSGTLKPSLSATGNLARNRNENESQFFGSFEETYDDYGYGITARQPLYRFDWAARGMQAEALDTRARLSLEGRQQAFAVHVAERYIAVLIAEAEFQLAETEARAIGKSLADTQKRFNVGLVAGTDLKEATARNDLAQARIILARQELISARDALDESTGNGHAELPGLSGETGLPALKPADIEDWVSNVRKNNPDVLLAGQAVVIAESEAKSARSEVLPHVDAVASYRHSDTSDSRIGSERDDARIGLELEVPIYAGGIGRSLQREANARLEVARAQQIRTVAEIERRTRQLFRQTRAAYAQEKALALAVSSAEAAREATENGYKAGTRTITDVLNARSAVTTARRDHAVTRYNLLLNWLRLKAMNAELGTDEFEQLDALLTSGSNKEG